MGYDSTRPGDGAERAECIRAAERLLAEAASPWVVQTLLHGFMPVKEAYEVARSAWREAQGEVDTATAASAAAALEVVRTFRWWTGTVRDENGKLQPRALSALTDNILPGQLVRLPRPKMLYAAQSLLEQLKERPWLRGDPGKLAAFAKAVDALAETVAVEEHAANRRLHLSRVHQGKAKAFDRAWGVLVRVIASADDPERLLDLPVFHRADRKSQRDEALPPEPPSEAAPEESQQERREDALEEGEIEEEAPGDEERVERALEGNALEEDTLEQHEDELEEDELYKPEPA